MAAVAQNVITDLFFCNNIPTFVITFDKDMETTLIRIGNSRGIIIPSAILKRLGVKDGAKVKLEEKEDGSVSLSFAAVEEPFTGPFTGPFRGLSNDPEAWGGEMDPLEYARMLHDSRVNTREIPDW
jgi:hypothetical protein